ncbi:MAG: DNA translocase FtsK [Clostridia bacterium]|nr:DNA translocase FtsK [Clostridia bacterium]
MLGSSGSIIALIGLIVIGILLITHFSIRAYFEGLREKRELKLAESGAPSRKKQKLYSEDLSGENRLESDGFIKHSGRPLTSGDSDYDYAPVRSSEPTGKRAPARNTNNYIDERKRSQREENAKKNAEWLPLRRHKDGDDLEFLPLSGPLETGKKSRRRGKDKASQSELKESFGYHAYSCDPLSADVEIDFGDADTAFGGVNISIPPDKKTPSSGDDLLAGVPIIVYDPKLTAVSAVNSVSSDCEPAKPAEKPVVEQSGSDQIDETETAQEGDESVVIEQPSPEYVYQRPPINLLKLPDPTVAIGAESPEEKARVLIETLKSFNIEAKIVNISIGPSITRFELQPAQGVRVNKITGLSNDIALALAASRVRIEAPIPGKSAIGIEIPNSNTAAVLLRELIDNSDFSSAKSPLTFAVGKDITGNAVYADLGRMPHMLVAGQTGSGKSVCINGIILSLVYKSSPKDVRMILIDPKVVELSIFSTLPHLYCPVVTEPKKAAGALRWAVNEMDQRYKRMAEVHARDIDRYNAVQKDENERWPRLVIIIDELADLMIVAGKDVEDSICRIAQLGRACGIHLIVATQRPSADVITGLIKANIPTRIAFAVANSIDSRVILDATGADKLLGRGDMLFHPNGAPKPIRAQGAYVDDEEVEAIAEFFTQTTSQQPVFKTDMLAEITGVGGGSTPGQGNGKQEDELLPDAVRLVIESGAASISMIQRRLRVGYARAARLIDIMEQKRYVSEADGSKPRKVLLDAAGYNEIFGGEIASSNIAVDDGGYDDDQF